MALEAFLTRRCVATTSARTTENTVSNNSSIVVVELLLVNILLPSNGCCLFRSRCLETGLYVSVFLPVHGFQIKAMKSENIKFQPSTEFS
jgi:hypothetical protein